MCSCNREVPLNEHQRQALRVALQIDRAQSRLDRPVRHAMEWPSAEWNRCRRLAELLPTAQRRGWHTAAGHLQQRLERELHSLRLRLDPLQSAPSDAPATCQPLDLRTLHQEVLALFDTFDRVQVDLQRRTLSVITEPIELQGIDLGRFEIQLRYTAPRDTPRYEVIALDPHPAASNSSVTHPHVQDDRLCEGDGRAAIRSAVAQGRLSDFFQIVVQILQTYNDSSPYVSLDDWYGEPCEDCGATTRDDDRAGCGCCERLLCDQCQTGCSICCEGCCDSCTDRCDGCEEFVCRSCQQNCSTCGDAYCENCLDETLCETCQAARAAKEEDNDVVSPAATEAAHAGGAGTDAAVHTDCLGQTAVPA